MEFRGPGLTPSEHHHANLYFLIKGVVGIEFAANGETIGSALSEKMVKQYDRGSAEHWMEDVGDSIGT